MTQQSAFKLAWEESKKGNIVRLGKQNGAWYVKVSRLGSLSRLI